MKIVFPVSTTTTKSIKWMIDISTSARTWRNGSRID